MKKLITLLTNLLIVKIDIATTHLNQINCKHNQTRTIRHIELDQFGNNIDLCRPIVVCEKCGKEF